MTGSFSLDWDLLGPGSARCHWGLGGDVLEIRTSYVGDALASLLDAATDLKIGARATIAVFLGEPGGHRLFFSDAAKDVYVQVVAFADLSSPDRWWQDADLRWQRRIPTGRFVEAVEHMSAGLLERYGEDGYLSRWGLPFPSNELAALQAAHRVRGGRLRQPM